MVEDVARSESNRRENKGTADVDEIQRDSVFAKNATTAADGKDLMGRPVMHLLAPDVEPDSNRESG